MKTLDPRIASTIQTDAFRAAATRNIAASLFNPAAADLAEAADVWRRAERGDADADAATMRCDCLVSAAAEWGASRGELMSQAEGDAFFAACMLEPDEFEKALASQNVNVEACKPWWKRRSTKVAAGVVASLLVVGLVVRSRRK